jgi:hypothetical protein
MQVTYSALPARFRECALDTHDTLPPYDHREKRPSGYKSKHHTRHKQTVDLSAYVQRVLGAPEAMPQTDISGLLVKRSKAFQQSDWALLDTLEAHLCHEGRSRHAQQKRATCNQTRSFLDGQMQVWIPELVGRSAHCMISAHRTRRPLWRV